MTTMQQSPDSRPIPMSEVIDMIEHVNEDHQKELLLCAQAFASVQSAKSAQIQRVFPEGLEVQVDNQSQLVFVPFVIAGTPHEALRATVQAAMTKLGQKNVPKVHHFTVVDVQFPSVNFCRLELAIGKLPNELWVPGDAYRFHLQQPTTVRSSPSETKQTIEQGAKQSKIPQRAYTIRHADAQSIWVDVFCHNTPQNQPSQGSLWAKQHLPGDQISLSGGRREHFPDFEAGTTLLLGDETSLPTIAALLEQWSSKWPLHVMVEIGDLDEQAYLNNLKLPPQVQIHWVKRGDVSGQALVEAVAQFDQPVHAAWGALEGNAAKQIKADLCERHNLERDQCRVGGYWKL